jgi:succinate dehydrogenase/fumarate reductase flavoprotein subunit
VQAWDVEADVVVVGYGGAGAAAAIAAAGAGARVLILEKQPEAAHFPTTAISGGFAMVVHDVDAATRYLDRCSDSLGPIPVLQAWAERASQLEAWLEGLQVGLRGRPLEAEHLRGAAHPELEGAAAVENRQFADTPNGSGLMAGLKAWVGRCKAIEVRWASPATRLLRSDGGGIDGVAAAGGAVRVRALSGVVLSCGGFEHDERMKADYLRAHPVHFASSPASTGDGVRMALAAGADLWHMNAIVGRQVARFHLPDHGPYTVQMQLGPPGYVVLDRFGRRFSDERAYTRVRTVWYEMFAFDPVSLTYSRIPSFWVFDRRRFEAGPLESPAGQALTGVYRWSPDNRRELAAGWIVRGDSVAEVAERAGIADPLAAQRSVEAYNRACARGSDEFRRPAESLVPLDRPPYYCVPLYPGASHTCGGPRRNERGEVLDPFGEPIPGLYGAGELGQAIAHLYPSPGASLSEALCSGQIAGESAAAAVSEN